MSRIHALSNGHSANANGHAKGAHDAPNAPMKVLSLKKTTPEAIAAFVGIALAEPLPLAQARSFKKPYPGHTAVLAHVLELLGQPGALPVKIDLAELKQAIDERERLASLEAALVPVARTAADRRQIVDDRIMGALARVARAVRASDDETIAAERSFLSSFLGQFGRMGARAQAAKKAAEKKSKEDAKA